MTLDDGKVSAEYLKQAAERIRSLKERSYQRMEITTGDTLLDVGCGPGMDSVPLARLVGETGQVIAVDNDQAMLDEALRHAEENGLAARISHRLGSALALPLADSSVDLSDTQLEHRLMEFFATQMRPHGFAGRRLYPLCNELGLGELTLDVVALPHHNFDETPFGNWLIDTALKAGVMNEQEAQQWREELTARSAAGRFYACVNMVVVSGCKAPV